MKHYIKSSSEKEYYKLYSKTEKYKKYQNEYKKNKIEFLKETSPEEYEKLKSKHKKYSKKSRESKRRILFNMLGGCFCSECGCDIFEALELNHKNGGGYFESRKLNLRGSALYNKIISTPSIHKNYNVLCRVCNANHYLRDIKNIKEGTWQINFTKVI